MRRIRSISTLSFTLLVSMGSWAQGEELRALSVRPMPEALIGAEKSGANTYFNYLYEPQEIPLVDDFSIDRTRHRWARTDDPGVVLSETFYHLEVGGVSEPDMSFSLDTTFRIIVDISDPDNVIISVEALASVEVTVRDLDTYPPLEQVVTAWPAYTIVDTLQLQPPDTIWMDSPDLVQDTLLVYDVAPDPGVYLTNGVAGPLVLWEDDDVYVNGTYPVNPPTVGVATFDGLARTGLPYDYEDYSSYGIADRLTSVPIQLAYSVADSIYLSFFYQARGLSGDAFPQPQDSLVLEFFAPDEDTWYRVWRSPYPSSVEALPFQQVMIPIKEFRYLKNGFRMRFLNYATLSGSFDHWHLDYVRLGEQRTFDDTTLVDVAWIYPEASILETYTSVPFNKIDQATASYMATNVSILQRNLDDEDRFITWRMQAGLAEGPVLFDPPSYGNNTSGNAHTVFASDHPINSSPNNFVYDTGLSTDDAFWKVRFLTNATPDINRYNDTITFIQELSNYYAYDDGSAEMGYGLNVAAAKLAYRFDMIGGDSLRAVRMYFNPIANQPPLQSPPQGNFLVTVWSSLDPEVIVHQNFSFSSPEYRDHGLNKFVEYELDSTIWLEGTFYIGWVQTNATNMNLGFDRNRNNGNKIFFKVANTWQSTAFQGSLMMRPVFVAGSDPWVGTPNIPGQDDVMVVYPNPARDILYIDAGSLASAAMTVECIDAMGRKVLVQPFQWNQGVATDRLANGIHLLRLLDRDGNRLGESRVIIQR